MPAYYRVIMDGQVEYFIVVDAGACARYCVSETSSHRQAKVKPTRYRCSNEDASIQLLFSVLTRR